MSYIKIKSGLYTVTPATTQVKHANYVKNTDKQDKKRNMAQEQQKPTIKGN